MATTELVARETERDVMFERRYDFYRKAVWAVNWDDRATKQAMLKLAQNMKPGSIIPLTREEFRALKDNVILVIPSPTEETDGRQLELPL